MGTGYARKDTTNNIANGNVINASDLDAEFDGVEAAFDESTGHDHGGGADNGAPITKVGPAQDVVVSISAVTPKTDNTLDLGSSTLEFKDLWIDGTANIDSLVADTADINGGSVDGVTIGTNSVVTDLRVDNIQVNGNTISSTDTNGNVVIAPNGTGDVQLDADTVRVGDLNANATVTTNGTGDLILNTNAGTNSGSITIEDGVNGNIIIAPNGTGQVQITNASLDLTSIEVTNIKAKDGTAAATIADSTGKITVSTELAVDNLNLSGNTISSTDTNGNIVLAPNGTGDVQVDADTFRVGDSGANATISSNGDADLILQTGNATTGTVTLADGANGNLTLALNGTGQVVVNAGAVGTPTIAPTGDLNTGIFFPAADTIAFAEGGVESMRITSTGDILLNNAAALIGTNTSDGSDTNSLVISGGGGSATGRGAVLQLFGNENASTGIAQLFSGNVTGSYVNIVGRASDSYIRFDTGGTNERMRITSAGEVLVGGTTEIGAGSGYLTIQKTDTAALFLYRNDTSIVSGNAFGSIGFYGNDTTSNTPTQHAYIQAVASGTHAAGDNPTDLVFGTTADGSATVAEKMRINSEGNVGIGTSSPTRLLQINGSSGVPLVNFNGYDVLSWDNSVQLNFGGITASQWTALKFYTGGSERMRIDSSGNVGIGTTAPNTNLQVVRSTSGAIANFTRSAGQTAVIYGDGTGVAFGNDNGSGALGNNYIYFVPASNYGIIVTNSAERMRIDSSGNVGIGTSSPAYKLDVDRASVGIVARFKGGTRSAHIYSDNDAVYFTSDTGVATAFGCNETSDLLTFYTGNTERARITSGGNLLVGTTTDAGSTSNTTPVVAGAFRSFNGSVTNTTINVATNLVTLPSGGMFLFRAYLGGVGTPANSESLAIITCNAGAATQTNLKTGSWIVINLSGLTVTGTQNQATGYNISWSVMALSG